ncbi:MAG: twin-arginine translocation signal domain-containing protein, partial [Gammaproteobacteria bacterium]
MNDYRLKPKTRRDFLKLTAIAGAVLGLTETRPAADRKDRILDQDLSPQTTSPDSPTMTLFLCGDVMTGRGIDQVLPHPGDPRI